MGFKRRNALQDSSVIRLFITAISLLALTPLTAVESNHCCLSNDSLRLSNALHCLDQAIDLSLTIKEENERTIVSSHFIELKQEIQSSCQRKDFSSLHTACECVYENTDEILAELNHELRTKIGACICSMMKEIEGLSF